MPAYPFALVFGLVLAGCGTAKTPAPITEWKKPGASQARSASATSGFAQPKGKMEGMQYRVQPGDTLFKIAFQHGVDVRRLGEQNGIGEPFLIYPGQVLVISAVDPARMETATARPLAGAAEPKPPPSREPGPVTAAPAPRPSPSVQSPDPEEAPEIWLWPARGQIVTGFDEAAGAKGIDIAGTPDTPVKAAAKGRVVYAGSGLRGYGKLAIVKHSTAMLSAYGHLSMLMVEEGQGVMAGQIIGRMGDTDADRVKLHFEIREFGKPVDPIRYLR